MAGFNGQRAPDALALQQLIADYCYELDLTGGINAFQFFTEDGRLEVGTMAFTGHEEMKAFYQDFLEQVRESETTGERTTRHVFSNLRIDFTTTDHAVADFIVMNFSSGGTPPIQGATSATIISDVRCKCQRTSDGDWLIAEFTGAPIFLGDDPLQQKALTES